jgi:hypothetical protein
MPNNKTIKKRTKQTITKKKYTYTENDYNSNDGMLTYIWGPPMWHYLHTMSFNYPVNPTRENKIQYRDFILSLQNVLPCGKCRKNLKKNFKKLPLKMSDMKSRHTFSLYIYNLHEVVNKMLNKDSRLSYEEVRERYEHFRARCAIPYSSMVDKIKDLQLVVNKKNEIGCTEPLYGEKSKCVLHIIPQNEVCDTIQIDEKCIKHKIDIGTS